MLRRILVLVCLWLLIGVVAYSIVQSNNNDDENVEEKTTILPDTEFMIPENVQKYFDFEPSQDEFIHYMQNIADVQGADIAFSILIHARLSEKIDVHTVGHVLGYALYDQYGLAGLSYCTSDLMNACAHSVVEYAFIQEGEHVLPKLKDGCAVLKDADSYNVCLHGLGHGILGYVDYDIPRAIELCQRLGREVGTSEAVIECAGGVIMEMHDGKHDPVGWVRNSQKYIDKENPFALCEASYMTAELKPVCYFNISPFIVDSVKEEGSDPSPALYSRAINRCSEVENVEHKTICYSGFGLAFSKEYGRNLYTLASFEDKKFAEVAGLCNLASDTDGANACTFAQFQALFKHTYYPDGHELITRYCLRTDELYQADCFKFFLESAFQYNTDPTYKKNVCAYVERRYKKLCSVE